MRTSGWPARRSAIGGACKRALLYDDWGHAGADDSDYQYSGAYSQHWLRPGAVFCVGNICSDWCERKSAGLMLSQEIVQPGKSQTPRGGPAHRDGPGRPTARRAQVRNMPPGDCGSDVWLPNWPERLAMREDDIQNDGPGPEYLPARATQAELKKPEQSEPPGPLAA